MSANREVTWAASLRGTGPASAWTSCEERARMVLPTGRLSPGGHTSVQENSGHYFLLSLRGIMEPVHLPSGKPAGGG